MQPQLLTVIKEEVLKTWTLEEWKMWRAESKFDGARLIYHKGSTSGHTINCGSPERRPTSAWMTARRPAKRSLTI